MPRTVPHTVPHTVPGTVPHTVPGTVPRRGRRPSEPGSQTVSEPGSQTVSEPGSQTVFEPGSQTVSDPVSQTVSDTVCDTLPGAVCDAVESASMGQYWLLPLVAIFAITASAQAPPADPHRKYFQLGDLKLEGGAVLPNAKLAYATFGTLNAQRSNAVLLPSWYGSDHHGYDFLIGPGRSLDPARDFIVLTEMFSNGWTSSPSNTPAPFDGPRFPPIAIRDNVTVAHRLLTSELGVSHLRAIIGFSMGAQQAFQWAASHPGFADRIVAYCGTAKTYPHGVVRLDGAISALTADAAFADGNYTAPPRKGLAAWSRHWAGWVFSQEWWRRELFKPRWPSVEAVIEERTSRDAVRDPNNLIAQARTWQRHNIGDTPGFNGDHEKALRAIQVPVLYMPCETDLYFPVGDARYESEFIRGVKLTPIPSLWGHSAGSGSNPADNDFIDAQIRQFLK